MLLNFLLGLLLGWNGVFLYLNWRDNRPRKELGFDPDPISAKPKEVIHVHQVKFQDAEKVTLYVASDPNVSSGFYGRTYTPKEWHGNRYLSCAQAFEECPGARVDAKTAYLVDGHYIESNIARKIMVQPKPDLKNGD